MVVTRFAGREFQGMTTRFEKKYLSVLVLERGWKAGGGGQEKKDYEKKKKSTMLKQATRSDISCLCSRDWRFDFMSHCS